jgi:hypothetical protein
MSDRAWYDRTLGDRRLLTQSERPKLFILAMHDERFARGLVCTAVEFGFDIWTACSTGADRAVMEGVAERRGNLVVLSTHELRESHPAMEAVRRLQNANEGSALVANTVRGLGDNIGILTHEVDAAYFVCPTDWMADYVRQFPLPLAIKGSHPNPNRELCERPDYPRRAHTPLQGAQFLIDAKRAWEQRIAASQAQTAVAESEPVKLT